MALVFAELRHATRRERGWLALLVLWMKETSGLVKFGWRERFGRRAGSAAMGSGSSPNRGGGWDAASELKWAWRAVRARGWRTGLSVGLLAVALAANVLMFAIADSLVLHRVPYREADRIVEISNIDPRRPDEGNRFLSAVLLDEWRKQVDLFSSVQGYLSKTTFLVGDGMAELVRTVDVTPGLLELLGVSPKWGRVLTEFDARDAGQDVVVIAEGLAQKRFGRPDLAVGRTLTTTAQPMIVVGVMPAAFFFPEGGPEIWRALDPRGPLARGFAGVASIARIAPGVSIDSLKTAMAHRGPGIGETAGRPAPYTAIPAAFYVTMTGPGSLFYLLLGAAVCLLLIACANVASLELATALPRARHLAIQASLGASRWLLARVALFEGALLSGVALLGAAVLARLGIGALEAYMPSRMWLRTANPIDLDFRAIAAMTVAAAVTWLFVSWPVVTHASRPNVAMLLKAEDRAYAATRTGALLRRGLTLVEVALAVLLMIGGVLYATSYQALLRIEKGFDSRNLAQIGFTIPVQFYTNAEMTVLAEDTLRRLRAVPGVLGASRASAPPASGDSPTVGIRVEVDDLPPSEPIGLGTTWVDPDYLRVVGLPLQGGRWITAEDTTAAVVIPEAFAKRFWPDVDPVGRRFREAPERPWNTVVGVVGNVRNSARNMPTSAGGSFNVYRRWTPPPAPPPPKPGGPPPRATGGSWRFLTLTVRLASEDRAVAVLAAARAADPRVRVELDFVDELYASQHASTQLAARTVGAFATVAFVTALGGIYGVMAFLVAGRTREIGIRMALGASAGDISRLVMRSSVTMVGAGAALGVAAALAASRWMGSQFFGVTPTSPGTYLLVVSVVIVTALAATWRPARAAASVDPARTLNAN